MADPQQIDPALVADIDLLCLDAGNTVIYLDHTRLAKIVHEVTNVEIAPDILVRTEGEAKRLAETGGLVDVPWTDRHRPGARAWGKMIATIVMRGGVNEDRLSEVVDAAWRSHEKLNLWCKVPDGLGDALNAIRVLGVKVAIISNSEGMLDRLFTDLNVLRYFDLVVDSGVVGFEKPDPRIFRIAFDRFNVSPEHAIHLGDVFATDILGARAAGCRYALIDPFDHYQGAHMDVPRVPGAVAVARAIHRHKTAHSA